MPESVVRRSPAPLRLGPWLGVSLLLIGAGLWLACAPLNQTAFMALNHSSAQGLSTLWASLTMLGFGWPVILLLLALHRGPVAPVMLLKGLLLAGLFVRLPRALVHSPRPLAELPPEQVAVIGKRIVEASSMPSGHTVAAFTGVGLCWLIARLQRRRAGRPEPSPIGLPLLLALGVAIGASRVMVGAHWPADVVVGAGVGLLAAGLAGWSEQRRPWAGWVDTPKRQRLLGLLEIALACGWAWEGTGYPQGEWLKWLTVGVGLVSGVWRWISHRPNPRPATPRD